MEVFLLSASILVVVVIILIEVSYLLFAKYLPTRSHRRKVYVDTSALIDGRVLGIVRTGFLNDDLIVLKSVLRELQLLADGKDAERRMRARVGLDTAAELERIENINVIIVDDAPELHLEVDEQLLKYAKKYRGAILTMDYNLIKVAEAEKIVALNANDLALSVRTKFQTGEKVPIKLTEKGSNRGQAVGHLGDGTMVVVDNAADKIGKDVVVVLTKFHESSTGKLVFARLTKTDPENFDNY